VTSSGTNEQGEEDGADGHIWEQGGYAAQCLILRWIWRARRSLREVRMSAWRFKYWFHIVRCRKVEKD
jgi:hypothetical protein